MPLKGYALHDFCIFVCFLVHTPLGAWSGLGIQPCYKTFDDLQVRTRKKTQ